MFQDPSIGDIKVYYVVTKIIVLNSTVEQVRIRYHSSNVIGLITGLFRVHLMPLFQNEASCKMFHVKVSSSSMKINPLGETKRK